MNTCLRIQSPCSRTTKVNESEGENDVRLPSCGPYSHAWHQSNKIIFELCLSFSERNILSLVVHPVPCLFSDRLLCSKLYSQHKPKGLHVLPCIFLHNSAEVGQTIAFLSMHAEMSGRVLDEGTRHLGGVQRDFHERASCARAGRQTLFRR
jgi:hypothetical protein